jgi:hypothetical protein
MGVDATAIRVLGLGAHDAAVAGGPVIIGAKATAAEPAAVTEADASFLSVNLAGRLRVNAVGNVADDVADDALPPVKGGGVAIDTEVDENISAVAANDAAHLSMDLIRRLRCVVTGAIRDDAAANTSAPVKVGGVADAAVSAVADGDAVHFVTDLYRRQLVSSVTPFNNVNWVDSDQVAADAYYPSEGGLDLDIYRNVTVTGKVICGADNSSILTVQVTNDEDATPANRDWQTIYVYSNIGDANIASIATVAGATSQICLSLNGLGFRYVRILYNITVATTNKDTVILKARYEA